MPTAGSDVEMDFDAAGLCNWARTRFGLEIDPSSLRESSKDRQKIEDTLYEAAEAQIRAADLSGLVEFVQPNFSETQMSRWAKDKLDMDVPVSDIVKASKGEEGRAGVTAMIMRRVNEIFERREIEYPIEYAMQIAQMTMRQNPGEAAGQLVAWANRRFDLALTPDEVMKRSPQAFRQQMFEHARKFVESKAIEKAVSAAQACKTDEDLANHVKTRFQRELPEHMRFLEGQERQDAIRSFVENQLRTELLQFERSILLETLDSAWKDHLYAMDQLRDTINFRAISQQDPRTEFKREGSHQFATMMEGVRGRVSEYVFRARLMAQAPVARPPQAMATPMGAAAKRSPMAGGVNLGGGISGPGISGPGIG
jgi:preprotein translocase subunit SecA